MAEYIEVGIISLAAFTVVFLLIVARYGSESGSVRSSRRTYTQTSKRVIRSAVKPLPLPVTTSSLSSPSTVKAPRPAQILFPIPPCPSSAVEQQPLTLYHGTTLENALEIYDSGLWLIGSALPYAVWMGDTIKIAKQYSGGDGAIVVVNVNPNLRLTHRGGGVYVYGVLDAAPNREYYKIAGLLPVALIDPHGNRIR